MIQIRMSYTPSLSPRLRFWTKVKLMVRRLMPTGSVRQKGAKTKSEQEYADFMFEWIQLWSSRMNETKLGKLLRTNLECWSCHRRALVVDAFQETGEKIWLKCPQCGTPWWSANKKN